MIFNRRDFQSHGDFLCRARNMLTDTEIPPHPFFQTIIKGPTVVEAAGPYYSLKNL